jgi:hypothetical protein
MDVIADARVRNELRQLIEGIGGFKPETLKRSELGEISFEDALPLFQQINDFFVKIKGVSWDRVPVAKLPVYIELMKGLIAKFGDIRDFTVRGKENPSGQKNQLLTAIEKDFNSLYNDMGPHASFELMSTAVSGVRNDYEKAAAEAIDKLVGLLDETKAEVSRTKTKLEEAVKGLESEQTRSKAILEEIEKNAKQIGVTNEAGHFKLSAGEYGRGAARWLNTAGVFTILLVAYLLYISHSPATKTVPPNGTNVAGRVAGATNMGNPTPAPPGVNHSPADLLVMSQVLLPRLIVVTILFMGLVFSLRNYAAQSHNKVVNLHRQTALSSFQTFVTSTADPATKNAILIQATQAIYAPQPSGYLKNENEISQVPQLSLIADLVRGGKSEK